MVNTLLIKKNISKHTKNKITAISIAKDNVWFGSENGILYRYNNKNDKLDSILTIPKIKDIPNTIFDLTAVNDKVIFLNYLNGKILRYDIESNTLIEEKGIINGPYQRKNLASDTKGRLWISSEFDGLICYDINKKIVLKRFGDLPDRTTNKYAQFISIFCDKNDNVWAATDGFGIYKIKDFESEIYKHYENNPLSVSSNTVISITEDKHNNIWIVTKNGEINQLHNNNNNISFYSGLSNHMPLSVPVLSMTKSSDGSLWIGTDGKGINRITPSGETFQYNIDKSKPYYFEGKYINKIIEDSRDNIWIATYQNGLWVYNMSKKQFKKIELLDSANRPISDVRYLFKDSKDRIWVSIDSEFRIFSDKQKEITSFQFNDHGLFGRVSESICEDENGTLWTGILGGGLYRFEENKDNFNNSYFLKHNYYFREDNDHLNYNIKMITPDYQGSLWMTCTSGMLLKYDINQDDYESYVKEKNFEGVNFRSVLVQNPDNLWLSTDSGIYHYNLSTDMVKTYHRSDGTINNYFVSKSSYKDNEGQLYFGGEFGVSAFNPVVITKESINPKLYINTIEILNKPGYSIVPNQFNGFVENMSSLKLKHNQSSFSFQFSAIDDILNTNYQYAYRLKGFDEDWIISKDKNVATYTNIPSGTYMFEVKASTKLGEWNVEPKSIELYIKQPFWKSTLANIFYFVLVGLIAYSIYSWARLKTRLSKEAWQNTKEKEIYDLKMDFFAKMSHEIHTPLTLILGPIDNMLERADERGDELLKQRLRMISNNANRLYRISTELMSLRNKELGKLKIVVSKNDLIKDLKRIAVSFGEQARFKDIDFIQRYPDEMISIWYDTEKIEHVIYNLLSNAFKFTPMDGIIKLQVDLNKVNDQVEIAVINSGLGIQKEELDDIFKLFYQTDVGKQNKGSGIGLALSKELVNLHHGTISVTSSSEFGTCFKVSIPTDESVFSEDQKIENNNITSHEIDAFPIYHKINPIDIDSPVGAEKKYTLLIVEDNVEMQIFLRDILNLSYNLLFANNGEEGIEMASEHIPDLIISDIMMPAMDGYEMCKRIQDKKIISHIPIILLTAENTSRSKIMGLKSGAIEYLKKPFNFNELLLKINNILISKEKVLSKYKIDLISAPQNLPDKTKDAIFMEDLVRELTKEVENPDFKLEELSNSLNMSYSVIFRKCHEITGKTLVEFARFMRIRKAALLIVENGYNISESAYMVGYKDSKYFTKCFKEEFGVPPATFKKEAKKIGIEKLLNKYKIQL